MLVIHVSFHLLIEGKPLFTKFALNSFFFGVDPVMPLHVPWIAIGIWTARIFTFEELTCVYYLVGYEFCFSLEITSTFVFIAMPTPFLLMLFFVPVQIALECTLFPADITYVHMVRFMTVSMSLKSVWGREGFVAIWASDIRVFHTMMVI